MKIETANLERRELYDLIAHSITPLPIALISTISQDGIYNAAPYSFVVPVSLKPPIICVSFGLRQGQKKDTLKNIEFSHDFVINFVDEALVKQATQASVDYPSDVDEIKEIGLTSVPGEKVQSPRVAESKISLECQLVQKLELVEELVKGHGLRSIIFGKVVLIHIKDELWVDGKIEPSRLGAVGRLGKDLYCKTTDMFEMKPS